MRTQMICVRMLLHVYAVKVPIAKALLRTEQTLPRHMCGDHVWTRPVDWLQLVQHL